MRIFALQGRSDSGKSSALIHLFQLIKVKYPRATVQGLTTGTIDIKAIIYPVLGQRIGIESRGDPNSRLQQSLADFRSARCDIVFCACRTRGMTVNWIKAMSPPDSVQFVPKAPSQSAHKRVDAVAAANLMRLAGI